MSSSCPVTQVTLRFLIRLSHGFCHAEVNVALKKILKGLFGCKHGIIWEPWPRTTAVSCDELSASITHGDIIWSCALTFPGVLLVPVRKTSKTIIKTHSFWWGVMAKIVREWCKIQEFSFFLYIHGGNSESLWIKFVSLVLIQCYDSLLSCWRCHSFSESLIRSH